MQRPTPSLRGSNQVVSNTVQTVEACESVPSGAFSFLFEYVSPLWAQFTVPHWGLHNSTVRPVGYLRSSTTADSTCLAYEHAWHAAWPSTSTSPPQVGRVPRPWSAWVRDLSRVHCGATGASSPGYELRKIHAAYGPVGHLANHLLIRGWRGRATPFLWLESATHPLSAVSVA